MQIGRARATAIGFGAVLLWALLELRPRHRAKRRLMEVLDGVERGGRED